MDIKSGLDYLRITTSRSLRDALPVLLPDIVITNDGRYGYTARYGIDDSYCVYYHHAKPDANKTVQISGRGIAMLRSTNGVTDDELITRYLIDKPTRIDYAIDLLDSGASIADLYQSIEDGTTKIGGRKSSWIKSRDGNIDGYTVYVGSYASDRFIRIYDKAAQLKLLADIIRVELVVKGKRAPSMLANMHSHSPYGAASADIRAMIPDTPISWLRDATSAPYAPKTLVPRPETNAENFAKNVIIPFLDKRKDSLSWATIERIKQALR